MINLLRHQGCVTSMTQQIFSQCPGIRAHVPMGPQIQSTSFHLWQGPRIQGMLGTEVELVRVDRRDLSLVTEPTD